jgi:hypothetical protein
MSVTVHYWHTSLLAHGVILNDFMWRWCRNCGSVITLDLLGLLNIDGHKATYVVCRAFVQSVICVFSDKSLEWTWNSNNKVLCLTSTMSIHYWSTTSRFHCFYGIRGKSESWLFKKLPRMEWKWIETLLSWAFIKPIITYLSPTHLALYANCLHRVSIGLQLAYNERYFNWITKYLPGSISASIHQSYMKRQT